MSNHPLSNEKTQERYEDLLFTKVMALSCKKESVDILKELESESPASDSNPINKIIRKNERKQMNTAVFILFKKTIVCLSLFFFISAFFFTTTLAVSAEAREYIADAVYRLVYEYDERYTAVAIDSGDYVDPELYTWRGANALTYIPEGFVFSQEHSDLDTLCDLYLFVYLNGEKVINFGDCNDSAVSRINTENADRVENIMIGDSEALLVVNKDSVHIVWSRDRRLLNVSTYMVPVEEAIKVAQGIKPFK